MGRIEHVKEFGNIIVKNVGGAPIRIRDVGYAEDGIAERRTFALLPEQTGCDSRCAPSDRHEHGSKSSTMFKSSC